MATATATLRHYRQSPQKVRLVADLVRGKRVDDAVETLRFTTKRAAKPVRKLIESAQANARDKQLSDDLVISTITVNEGVTLFRSRPAAMGGMRVIRKRTSHVYVVLEEQQNSEARHPKSETKAKVSKET